MRINNYFVFLTLFLIVILCILLGGKMIFNGDFFYLSDQGRDMLLTKNIVVDHKITLIGAHSGIDGFFHGPFWLYLLTIPFLIGGGNPFVFELFYVFLTCITIVLTYFLISNLYDKKMSLLTAFFIATSPFIWSPLPNTIGVNLMPLDFLLIIFFLIKYLRGRKNLFPFFVFFTGFTFQIEAALALVATPILIIYSLLVKKITLKPLILGIIAFILSVSTFIIFDLKHQFLMSKALLAIFKFHKHGAKDTSYLTFIPRLLNHAVIYKDVLLSFLFEQNVFLIILATIMFLYFIYLTFRKNLNYKFKKEYTFYFFLPLAIFIIYQLYPYKLYQPYVYGLVIPSCLFFASVAYQLLKDKIGRNLVFCFILVELIFISLFLISTYSKPYTTRNNSGSYLNQKNVINWIYKDSKGKNFSYFVYTPEIYTYGADYLFWYYSNLNHSKAPDNNKKQYLTYLIMYPPLSGDNNAHAFWKKHVIHTNSGPVKKIIFDGNITLEKLHISTSEEPVDPNYYQNLIFR